MFSGSAMATAVRQHKSKVIAHVDGLAASAASVIALAAAEVEMSPGGTMMIHRTSAVAWGTADDMLEMAALLDKLDGVLVDEYVRETGNTAEQVKSWVDAETWFTAQEAVDHGFADRIAEDAPKADARWDLSAYNNAPILEPVAPPPAPEPNEAEAQHAENLRRLGLAEKTTA